MFCEEQQQEHDICWISREPIKIEAQVAADTDTVSYWIIHFANASYWSRAGGSEKKKATYYSLSKKDLTAEMSDIIYFIEWSYYYCCSLPSPFEGLDL